MILLILLNMVNLIVLTKYHYTNIVYICTTNLVKMIKILLITLLIVAISFLLLGLNLLLFKNRKFPNGHVSSNKHLRNKGVGCVQSQDREEQNTEKERIKQRI